MAAFQSADLDASVTADGAKHRLVLVVDDSRVQRKILSSSLRRWGYDVIEADSGEAAVEQCKLYDPGLVISDWMMPGMSGLEFCQHYRDLTGDSYGYFILLTSKSEKNDVAQGLDAGADDFLSKPVNGHELRARITAGERILEMQGELKLKNAVIGETLDELQRLYDSLDSDLLEAKKLQQSLIPDRHMTFEGSEVSFLLRSSGHVGGDLVGYYPAGDGHLGLYALDVSGHGISSALMTTRLAGLLSNTALHQNVALERGVDGEYRSRRLDQALESLNELVLEELETEHYFTMMLVDVDLRTGRLDIGQAGHPHPVIQRKNGDITQNSPGGFPVGLMSGVDFSRFSEQLNPGDRLIILSDGVTECENEDGSMLGEDGLEELLREMQDTAAKDCLETLVWRLMQTTGRSEFSDDVSGLIFEFRPDDQGEK